MLKSLCAGFWRPTKCVTSKAPIVGTSCGCPLRTTSSHDPRLQLRHKSRFLSTASTKATFKRANVEVQMEKFYEESLETVDYFDVAKLVEIDECFAARMHLGHKRDCCSDAFREYLFGTRLNMDIIDLDKTIPRFQLALNTIAHVAFRNGIIMFVVRSGHREAHYVDKLALQVGEYSHTRQWEAGSLSRKSSIWGRVVRLPDVMVLFSCHNAIFQPHPALQEAANLGIATVGLVDSNCDPRLVTYPVPGNDDSSSSIRHFGNLTAKAVLAGKEKRVECLKSLGIPVELEDLNAYNPEEIYRGKYQKDNTELSDERKR